MTTIQEIKSLALERSGKCSKGDIWKAKTNNIQQEKWCPICRKRTKSLPL